MERIDQFVRRPVGQATVAIVGLLFIVLIVRGLWPTPQIGTDEDVFKTVDALFTAVNTRDPGRLADCESRLTAFRDSGKLPKSAAKNLDLIIKQARDGQWELSARRLYDFMMAQQRRSG